MSTLTNFEEICSQVSEEQRKILDTIWSYFVEKGEWMPTRLLHHKYVKEKVKPILAKLGGSVVFIGREGNKDLYHLTLLGVLLSNQREEIENLIVRYLEYILKQFNVNPEIDKITNNEVEDALSLSHEQSYYLLLIIKLGDFWGGGLSFSKDRESWTAGFPKDIDDFPSIKDFCKYVQIRALRDYNPSNPVDPSERYIKTQPSENEEPKGIFWYLDDQNLQQLLTNDWIEAHKVYQIGALKSFIVLCGGIIEGILFDVLGQNERKALEVYGQLKKGSTLPINRWELNIMLDVAQGLGLIKKNVFYLSNALREYRNLIHPGKQLRENIIVTQAEADIAYKALTIFCQDMSSYKGKN